MAFTPIAAAKIGKKVETAKEIGGKVRNGRQNRRKAT